MGALRDALRGPSRLRVVETDSPRDASDGAEESRVNCVGATPIDVENFGEDSEDSEDSAESADHLRDERIVRGLARGDEWAADALYARLQPVVERTLGRILQRRTPDFEDLIQTTFERIVRTLVEERLTQARSLAAWASAIATHVGLDALRARIRDRRRFDPETDPVTDDVSRTVSVNVEQWLDARRDLERLHDVLARMKSSYAETLVLHDVVGHDLTEIAKMTDVTVSAAQSRLTRGRKELLRRLGPRKGAL